MTTGEIEIEMLPAGPRPMGPIAIQRHPQGPRVFVLRRRVHEYVLGGVILCLALAAHLAGLEHHSEVLMVATALGVWLVAKDWRDIFPSKRDTASWRLGIHRRATPLRRVRKSESLPSLAALLTLSVAIVNLVSTLTANVPSRTRILVQVEPLSALPVFHVLALPAAAALAVVACVSRTTPAAGTPCRDPAPDRPRCGGSPQRPGHRGGDRDVRARGAPVVGAWCVLRRAGPVPSSGRDSASCWRPRSSSQRPRSCRSASRRPTAPRIPRSSARQRRC